MKKSDHQNIIVVTLSLTLGMVACIPVQRPYHFAVSDNTAVDQSQLIRVMEQTGLAPAQQQCERGFIYTKWEDTGKPDLPLAYDGDEATEVYQRYAVAIEQPKFGHNITVHLEAERCELAAVAVTGALGNAPASSCIPDQVPASVRCEPYDSSRLEVNEQQQLDVIGQKLERALSTRTTQPSKI